MIEKFIDGVANDEVLTEKNPFINEKLRSWQDSELAAEEWKSALLQNSSYGKSIDYSSNWYSDLSTVELLARLIYGENFYKSTYTSDQKAISRVVLNRTGYSRFGGETLKGVAIKSGQFATITGNESDTYAARNPETIKNRDQWQNATFLACLLCTTTDEYEWNQIAPMPTGIDTQLYFVGFNYAYKYSLFRSNNGELQYYMDGSWVNIYDVVVCGRGVLSSINELNDNSRNVNKNVFFNLLE